MGLVAIGILLLTGVGSPAPKAEPVKPRPGAICLLDDECPRERVVCLVEERGCRDGGRARVCLLLDCSWRPAR